jgi:hypothetical protein
MATNGTKIGYSLICPKEHEQGLSQMLDTTPMYHKRYQVIPESDYWEIKPPGWLCYTLQYIFKVSNSTSYLGFNGCTYNQVFYPFQRRFTTKYEEELDELLLKLHYENARGVWLGKVNQAKMEAANSNQGALFNGYPQSNGTYSFNFSGN